MSNTTAPALPNVLAFLAAFDVPNRAVPVDAARILLAVADGCDHVSDITTRTGLPPRTTARLVKLLAGRDRYKAGAWVSSPFSLVEVRPHPHRAGEQIQLSDQGKQVLARLNGEG